MTAAATVTAVFSLLVIFFSLLSSRWSRQAARLMEKAERDWREVERLRAERAERAEALTGGGRS